MRFDLKPRDRFIELEIEDATGRPVYGIVWDDSNEWVASFCGKTKKRIPSPGGDSIYVEVVAATTEDGCYPSTVTQGTVTAKFTHRKKEVVRCDAGSAGCWDATKSRIRP